MRLYLRDLQEGKKIWVCLFKMAKTKERAKRNVEPCLYIYKDNFAYKLTSNGELSYTRFWGTELHELAMFDNEKECILKYNEYINDALEELEKLKEKWQGYRYLEI